MSAGSSTRRCECGTRWPGSIGCVAVPIGQLYFRMTSPAAIGCAASFCPTAVLRSIVSATPSSITDSPALSGRSATAMLSRGWSASPPVRLRQRPCGAQRAPSASELSIAVVRLDRVHASDQRRAHLAFGCDDFFSPVEDVLDDRPRNDHHAVAIAQQIVARC